MAGLGLSTFPTKSVTLVTLRFVRFTKALETVTVLPEMLQVKLLMAMAMTFTVRHVTLAMLV